MPHPDGGNGECLNPVHKFEQAYDYVGEEEIGLNLFSGEKFTAKSSLWKRKGQYSTMSGYCI